MTFLEVSTRFESISLASTGLRAPVSTPSVLLYNRMIQVESPSVYGHLLIVSYIRYYIYRLWQRECQSYSQWKRFWTLNHTVSRNIPIIIAVVRFNTDFTDLNTTLIIDWYADSIGSNSCRLVSRTFNMILCHWCRVAMHQQSDTVSEQRLQSTSVVLRSCTF